MSYTELLHKLGLLDPNTAKEFNKWGFVQPEPPAAVSSTMTEKEVVTALQEKIEVEEEVEIRQTDPDILKQYLATQQKGKLHLVIRDLKGELQSEGTVPVSFGRSHDGRYIIPWESDSIEEFMVDPGSYLQDGRRRIRFSATSELWFGETKSFIIATPTESNEEEG